MSNHAIKTPCVGLCSTVYGDTVCRGCKRFHHEVIHWNGYGEEEKRAVWLRLEQLLSQVMASKVEIFDPARLREQLEQRKIRFVPHQSEYCWAYQLIARGARVFINLEAYGMVLLPEFRDWNLPELRDAIDREFFIGPASDLQQLPNLCDKSRKSVSLQLREQARSHSFETRQD